MAIYLIISFILIFFVSLTLPDEDKKKTIPIDDVLVGDKVRIKGEEFKVDGYTTTGRMELSNKRGTFIINVDPSKNNFILHSSGRERKYVEITGTKGTVGSDYLEKIKFN